MWMSPNLLYPPTARPGAKRTIRIAGALAGIALLALSGCSTAYAPPSEGWCNWPDPLHRDCREIVEFNHWR